jgi:hypothetical protein
MKKSLALVAVPFYTLAMLPLASLLASCGGGDKPAAPAATAADGHDHDHDHGDGHDHDHDHAAEGMSGHSHGETTQLGEQEVGGFKVKASRDGDVKPGGDVPIDVWITGGAKVVSVRFWVGTEDAKGALKAKAEIEGDHWHTHAEVSDPLPEGSKIWVEIEAEGGTTTLVGF